MKLTYKQIVAADSEPKLNPPVPVSTYLIKFMHDHTTKNSFFASQQKHKSVDTKSCSNINVICNIVSSPWASNQSDCHVAVTFGCALCALASRPSLGPPAAMTCSPLTAWLPFWDFTKTFLWWLIFLRSFWWRTWLEVMWSAGSSSLWYLSWSAMQAQDGIGLTLQAKTIRPNGQICACAPVLLWVWNLGVTGRRVYPVVLVCCCFGKQHSNRSHTLLEWHC